MRYFLFLFLLSGPIEAATVFTLESSVCENTASTLRSRALIFSRGRVSYALASDQGAYNNSEGESGICANIVNGSERIGTSLLAHDPLAGLALYRLDTFVDAGEFPAIGNAENREELRVEAQTPFSTRVVQAKSQRHYFSGLKYALEAKGGVAGPEFHRLGSPAFRADGTLVGFLGRYYLMYRPGLSTYVRRWVPTTNSSSFGYVILPAAYAKAWVESTLRSETAGPKWRVDLRAQIRGEYVLRGPGLAIKEGEAPPESDLEGEGPIGGIDGVGIGGIDTAFSLHQISFLPSKGNYSDLPPSLRKLGKNLREERILTLAFSGSRDPFAFSPLRVYNLESFLAAAQGEMKFFSKPKLPPAEGNRAARISRWVEATEDQERGNWEWQWDHIKASPVMLSSFYRCLFYFAWLKSDEWQSFPEATWRREFDPAWGDGARDLSIRHLLSKEGEEIYREWEQAWAP